MLPNWSLYVPYFPQAKVFPLTIGPGNLVIPNMPSLMNGVTIQGSVLAPTDVNERMSRFAAAHGIKPMVHRFVMDVKGVEEAFGVFEGGKDEVSWSVDCSK